MFMATWLLGAGGSLLLLLFAAGSVREREPRAARVAVLLAAALTAVTALVASTPSAVQAACLGLVIAAVGLLFRERRRPAAAADEPNTRVDERDIMFARARLVPGRPEYEEYYRRRPENQAKDDAARANPGLLSRRALKADPWLFAAADASFMVTEALRESVDGPVADERLMLPPESMTTRLAALARYFGAVDFGVTRLRPHHVYTHVGRGTGVYGSPVDLHHTHAIAFTVEMDHDMLRAGPAAPTVVESAHEYVAAAHIAVRLAAVLRRAGHEARAHIDGNYRVIAPLVARDAGLGEIGRLGLVITRRTGPRVRLGVVTTTAPLVPDRPSRDASIIDFCTICRKCAECCPAQAIPRGERQARAGVLRWRLDSDACFQYWTKVGTDCGRCVAVCPYSHPDNVAHRLVRAGVARSGRFRRAASWLDDLFYGRRPAPRAWPAWTHAADHTSEADSSARRVNSPD